MPSFPLSGSHPAPARPAAPPWRAPRPGRARSAPPVRSAPPAAPAAAATGSPSAGRPAGATRQTLFLAVVLTSQLMVVLDATIVNVALPHIQAALHFSTTGLSWVLNAYILTF